MTDKIMQMMWLICVVCFLIAALTGCLTSKTQTVTTNPNGTFSTNTVTTVNQANLALDSAGLQSLTSISVSLLVNKDPGLVAPLRDAQTALDGILNGSNPQSEAQVVAMLNAKGDKDLTTEITQLQQAVSQLEQDLLKKYGATVAGEVSVALTRAVERGLRVGLAGK